MKHIFVVISKEEYILNETVNKKIATLDIDMFNIVKYDYSISNPLEIIEDLRTTSLFCDSKAIILTNPTLLEPNYDNKEIADEFAKVFLEEGNINYIFILTDHSLDKSVHVNQVLYSVAEIMDDVDIKPEDLSTFVMNKVTNDGYKIDLETVNELLTRTDNDLLMTFNYIDQLETYKDDQEINFKDVYDLVPRHLDDDIFELLSAYISGDKKRTLEIYNDFILLGEDELRIMYSLFTKLQEIYYVKCMIRHGADKDLIAAKFNCKPGRAYYMMRDSKNISDGELVSIIKRLCQLDYDIKSGKVDKKTGLELFLLGV